MQIEVFPTLGGVPDEAVNDKVVIVVDVLRTGTTLAVALACGCLDIIPVLSPEEAIEMKGRLGDERVLLGGERNGLKIPGFDLGNSPLEYQRTGMEHKRLIFTSTNGTRALRRASGAKKVVVAALVNAPAVAQAVAAMEGDVSIICAGEREHLSIEDFWAAGFLVRELLKYNDFSLGDGALVARDYQAYRTDPQEVVLEGFQARQLMEQGFGEDIKFCLQIGIIGLVPLYSGGVIRKL